MLFFIGGREDKRRYKRVDYTEEEEQEEVELIVISDEEDEAEKAADGCTDSRVKRGGEGG